MNKSLPDGITLQVWKMPEPGELVYQSTAKWLHPLFGLTEHLAAHPEHDPSNLVLRDRVIGRAAAFLILRLGITSVWTDLASLRATALFADHGLVLHADRIVEKIECRTEDLLAEVHDFDQAWKVLDERRRISAGQRPGS